MKMYLPFIIGLIVITIAPAQIIEDSALDRLENGQVSFLEGEFIAFLADTCSPEFIEGTLTQLGYELTYIDIQPLTISLVNSPSEEDLSEFFSHPEILEITKEPAPFDSLYFKELLGEQNLSEEDYDAAYKRIIKSQSVLETFIAFNFHVTEDSVKAIMGNYRSIAYQIIPGNIKTVNIKTEPGSEQDVMAVIEELPFVESTALIGIITE